MFGLKSAFTDSKRRRHLATTPDVCFIWVPKNAGTAVFHCLNSSIGMLKFKRQRHFGGFGNRGAITFGHWRHQSLRDLGVIHEDYHQKAFKFAISRNPYSRAVSLFHYLTYGKNAPKYSIDHFLDDVMLNRAPVGPYHLRHLSQANPQVDWLLDDAGNIIPDMIYRFENFPFMESDLSKRFGTPSSFVKMNDSARRKTHVVEPISLEADILSDEARMQKIEWIYHRDFLRLDYAMKSSVGQSAVNHHFSK